MRAFAGHKPPLDRLDFPSAESLHDRMCSPVHRFLPQYGTRLEITGLPFEATQLHCASQFDPSSISSRFKGEETGAKRRGRGGEEASHVSGSTFTTLAQWRSTAATRACPHFKSLLFVVLPIFLSIFFCLRAVLYHQQFIFNKHLTVWYLPSISLGVFRRILRMNISTPNFQTVGISRVNVRVVYSIGLTSQI